MPKKVANVPRKRAAQSSQGTTTTRSSYIPRAPRPRRGARVTADRTLLQEARREEEAFMNTLMDPCGSPLVHGPYPGSRGYIQRFTQYYNLGIGVANTAAYVGFCPGAGVSTSSGFPSTGSAFAFAASSAYVPGHSFLTTNANSVRCLGACIQLWSDAAPLSITGNVFMGTVNWGELNNAGSFQNFLNLANYQGKLTADAFEQKWYPGAEDDQFKAYGVAPSAQDGGSQNMIFIGLSGLPASTVFSFRITWIVEYTPNAQSGMNTPSTDTSTGLILPSTVVKKLNTVKPNWFSRIGNFLSTASPYIAEGAKLAAGVAGLLI